MRIKILEFPPVVDEADADVRAIRAVNWITIKEGGLTGHNNDGKGVVKAIEKMTPIAGKRITMLGAGRGRTGHGCRVGPGRGSAHDDHHPA